MNENIIRRIKALMAKAESTAHPAEAEALMEKAEALIVQHSIELQWLAEDGSRLNKVVSRRWEWTDYKAIGKRRLVCSLAMAMPGAYALYGTGCGIQRGYQSVTVWADDEVKLDMIESVIIQAETALAFWWRAQSETFRKEGGYYAKKNNYLWGFGAGAGQRFDKLTSAETVGTSTALVLADSTARVQKEALGAVNGRIRKGRGAVTSTGFHDGLEDGLDADLGGRALLRGDSAG